MNTMGSPKMNEAADTGLRLIITLNIFCKAALIRGPGVAGLNIAGLPARISGNSRPSRLLYFGGVKWSSPSYRAFHGAKLLIGEKKDRPDRHRVFGSICPRETAPSIYASAKYEPES